MCITFPLQAAVIGPMAAAHLTSPPINDKTVSHTTNALIPGPDGKTVAHSEDVIVPENSMKSANSLSESVHLSYLDRLIFKLDFFFPQSFSPLDVAASLVRNAVHHRTTKQYYCLDDKRTFRAFRMVNSQGFRKTAIVCAFILAFLPTIEVPISVAAPCWLSFALELFCYSVFTLRLYLEHVCYSNSWSKNPWFCSLNVSIVLCWIDVVVTMALVTSSGGSWLSFNNCGMPEPSRSARSAGWIYVIGRCSRYVRPVIFMEWNIRARYLSRSMVRIISELLNILSMLGLLIFIFAAFGYFIWSDPELYISAVPRRFAFFRSFIQSVITMATLTTTENYPDCAIDYLSVSFINIFMFIAFAALSIFFALNVVLSSVYSTYQEHLKSYYHRRRRKDANGLARAFQYLCDSNKLMSRQRFQMFMRVYDGLSHLDPTSAKNKRRLKASEIRADFMFSMACARLRIVANDANPNVKSYFASEISESSLLRSVAPVLDAPLSFSEFIQLVPLIRCYFHIQDGSGSSFAKRQIMQQFSFADVMKRLAPAGASPAPVFSAHSTSYLVSRVDPSFAGEYAMVDIDRLVSTTVSMDSSFIDDSASLDTGSLAAVGASEATHRKSAGGGQSSLLNMPLLGSVGLNMSLSGLVQTQRKAPHFTSFVNHRFWGPFRSMLIFMGFTICVLQVEIEQALRQCERTQAGAQDDLWTGCRSWSYVPGARQQTLELGFNIVHLTISIVLCFDLVAEIWQKGPQFFVKSFGSISWLNTIDGALQLVIFIIDIYHMFTFDGTVVGPLFITASLLRLLRVYKVLSRNKTVAAIMTLFRNLYPIVKSFSLIAYTLFFVFGIFGMSLFSFAASSDGIAIYPSQEQYATFYLPRDASAYPNSNNPGNFGCNATDALGSQGVCGQAGPQSSLPQWDTTDPSPAAVAALSAAFAVGAGWDARVGGCFNLLGEANNRVLPCYCYYAAAKMNRTTSCDWLNPSWYRTDLGQVLLPPPPPLPAHLANTRQTCIAECILDFEFQRLQVRHGMHPLA